MPDWLAKTLEVLSALSGWVLSALAAACAVVLFAPAPARIAIDPLRKDWGGWFFAGLIFFGFLALARVMQWGTSTIRNAWNARATQILLQREVLSHLDTLSAAEREALKYLVEHNQRTAVGALHFGALSTLRSKGLLEVATGIITPLETPHTVPIFVWDELLKRKGELFGLL